MLDALIAGGADIFRLNFSHGTHQSQAATFGRIRAACGRAGREVAILQDLSGPKIRTGTLVDHRPIRVQRGDLLRIATGDFAGGPGRLSTTFAPLAASVKPGARLLLADGLIELRVESSDGQEIVTTVVDGGDIGEHKGINAPGVKLAVSAITQKDIDDLSFGLSLGVDMVALSFVQTADDIRKARKLLADANRVETPLVAKLERPQAVEHLGELLTVSDAVMVARGDMAIKRGDPRWFELSLANTIFGGAFNSRIVRNIREEKGYTYSPGSQLTGFADAGFYRFSADVRNEVTGPTLAEVFKEIDKMRAEGSDGAELQGAKQYMRGLFPIQTATQTGLALTLNNVYVFGLPKDYPETFRAKIALVTAEQVKSAASTLLGSQDSVITIVGDYAKVKDQLTGFKNITFLDADGKPVPPPSE